MHAFIPKKAKKKIMSDEKSQKNIFMHRFNFCSKNVMIKRLLS